MISNLNVMKKFYNYNTLTGFLAAGFMALITLPSANAENGFPDFNFTREDAVIEQPEGELKIYSRSGQNLSAYLGGVEEGDQDGLALQIVFDNDGSTVWFYNPISTAQSSLTWVKGEIRGNKLVIPEGSLAWYGDYGTSYTAYVLTNLRKVEGGEKYDAYECIPGDIEFTYSDSEFKLLPNESGIAAIGLMRFSTDEFIIENNMNYKWLGYGDIETAYAPFTEEPAAGPSADAEVRKYAFTYTNAVDGPRQGHLVDVAFEDARFYVRGLSESILPDFWVHADIDGNNIVFPENQYVNMAKIDYDNCFMYLFSSKLTEIDGEYYFDYTGNTTFAYDPQTSTIESDDILTYNCGVKTYKIGDYFMDMRLEPYVENPGNPANPSIGKEYEYISDYNMSSILVEIPCMDVDGNFIANEYLYFRIFVNGEPFTFEPNVYFGLTEPMTEIPYNFTDGYDIAMQMPGIWTIQLYGSEPQTIGVQSVYRKDGVEKLSDIVTFSTSGINTTSADVDVISTRYYDINGREVTNGFKGFVIMKREYSDGSVKVEKIVR